MSDAIRHVTVSGRVQGVGYRAFVDHAARSHDLEGWVRNRRDGSVEAVFVGAADVVNSAIQGCHEGPFAAKPTHVRAREASADDLALVRPGERFSVLPTT
jgi:acylphosphatase